jgi:phosphatidate cytidylyltransferase
MLSPGKTVEGAIGGLAGGILMGAALGGALLGAPVWGLVAGSVAGTAGQLGDLFESAIKRELGVKDIGRALPGHGGVLDRFDSLLFAAPVMALLFGL